MNSPSSPNSDSGIPVGSNFTVGIDLTSRLNTSPFFLKNTKNEFLVI